MIDVEKALVGTILGTAVGDALGLPREGLSPQRAKRLLGGKPLRHRFLLGRGMISDDTEHTCLVAQSLLAARGDQTRFVRLLAWRLRWWLLGLPAGIGWGTLRAIIKLWLGFGVNSSGVQSAGNGPAKGVAVLGAYFSNDRERLIAWSRAQTRLTHTDARAEQGSLAVAIAASHAANAMGGEINRQAVFADLRSALEDAELLEKLQTC